MGTDIVPARITVLAKTTGHLPAIIEETGANARFAYEEFLASEPNEHTRKAYQADGNRFLLHVHELGLAFHQTTPKLVRSYIENLKPLRPGATPLGDTPKKRVLAAIRKFLQRSDQARYSIEPGPLCSRPEAPCH